ncbi:MAG TPA: hypothetical protein VGW38_18650, partial [Chloroflexota bacterium]|nr:hypothetical protein [Chloroflexota bacterium]
LVPLSPLLATRLAQRALRPTTHGVVRSSSPSMPRPLNSSPQKIDGHPLLPAALDRWRQEA